MKNVIATVFLFALSAGACFVTTRYVRAAPADMCCSGDASACSGCKNMVLFWVPVGNNPVSVCTTPGLPQPGATCTTKVFACKTWPPNTVLAVFSENTCTTPNGMAAVIAFRTSQCDPAAVNTVCLQGPPGP